MVVGSDSQESQSSHLFHPPMHVQYVCVYKKANARQSLALCFPSEETGKLVASILDVKHFLTEKGGGASCC